MVEELKDKKLFCKYLVIVYGNLLNDWGVIEVLIGRSDKDCKK